MKRLRHIWLNNFDLLVLIREIGAPNPPLFINQLILFHSVHSINWFLDALEEKNGIHELKGEKWMDGMAFFWLAPPLHSCWMGCGLWVMVCWPQPAVIPSPSLLFNSLFNLSRQLILLLFSHNSMPKESERTKQGRLVSEGLSAGEALRRITHLFVEEEGSKTTILLIQSNNSTNHSIQFHLIDLLSCVWLACLLFIKKKITPAAQQLKKRRRKSKQLAQLHSQNKFHFHLFCWIPLCLAAQLFAAWCAISFHSLAEAAAFFSSINFTKIDWWKRIAFRCVHSTSFSLFAGFHFIHSATLSLRVLSLLRSIAAAAATNPQKKEAEESCLHSFHSSRASLTQLIHK